MAVVQPLLGIGMGTRMRGCGDGKEGLSRGWGGETPPPHEQGWVKMDDFFFAWRNAPG